MTVDQKAHNALYELFQENGTLHAFKRGDLVFRKDDPANNVFYIEDGLLKICQLSDSGQGVTFFIRKGGEYFGMAEIVLHQIHSCYAQCLTDCRIWVLPSRVVEERLRTDLQVNQEILFTLTNRLMHQEHMVEQLISKSVSARLAWLLCQLSRGKQERKKSIPLRLTHEEMSQIVGCSRQTISELFNEWRTRGIIHYTRNSLTIIQRDKLGS
ncbi:Crp/Fnr family transcriptional regulator [Sporolactobacillus sp. THM19-2]|jgi:CRP/FNR family transcriptional regulator|uniref:Crp/Fnr family transcriptional regulator n=1 Tax=Sporolactobacillus sp. THM19-2 TaxID=2511171 RepID=UPI0013EB46FB|nr:Crp/Fnr family transcriptional regulator [Sporolactobacillus sp. THM19-2]